MSKIEDLIKQHCPNGVEYKTIKEIAEIGTGSSNRVDAKKNGLYPFFVRSKDVLKINNFEFDEEAIIIPGEGGIGDIFHYIKGKYALHQRAYRIHFFIKELNVKFAYYYMIAQFKSFIFSKAVNATVTSIRKPMIEKFKLPVPPLPVQEEIVRVLDTFTALEAELEAELEARKRQYEYYRNKLLTFDENTTGGGIDWKILSEVFDIKNGYTPSKANKEFWKNGTIPWFRMEDIRENGRILNDSIQHITPQAVKGGKLFPANSIIVATTATIGEHALITVDSLANQRFTCLSKKVNRYNELDMKFFYYYMFVIDEWCKNNTNVSGFASVDMNKFKKLMIPIPPIEEQERIVAILDKFDSLVNDISEGLPAELTARRQQYEYYRNKLLTFDEAA